MNLLIRNIKLSQQDIFKMKKYFFTASLTLFTLYADAQQIRNVNKKQISSSQKSFEKKLKIIANKEFEGLNYAYSIPLFKAILSKNIADTSANLKLAYSYLMNNQFDSALKYYQIADNLGAQTYNRIPELFAMVGNYKDAIKYYKPIVNSNLLFKIRYDGFANINNLKRDSLDYVIYNTKLNTPYDEFAASYYLDGIVFESNRIKKMDKKSEFGWNGSSYSNLFYLANTNNVKTDSFFKFNWSEKTIKNGIDDLTPATSNDSKSTVPLYGFKQYNYNTIDVAAFGKEFDSKLNMGSASFTANGQVAYFTTNKENKKGISNLEIWEVKKQDSINWGKPVKLFFNKPEFSYFHPAISSDGQLLVYVSDEDNGIGGTDLYYIKKNQDGSWGNTNNMGQNVNTAANELFPSFSDNKLFFSSNGRQGLGGLDIYELALNNSKDANIQHLSYPINSNSDDFSFIIKNNQGFFSSNRYGSDDILSFDYNKVFIHIKGYIFINDTTKSNILMRALDKETNMIVDSTITDTEGMYSINLRPNRRFNIEANDGNGHYTSIDFTTNNYSYNITTKMYDKILPNLNIKYVAEKKPDLIVKKSFDSIIDSLKSLTNNYTILHHPFNNAKIIKSDLNKLDSVFTLIKESKSGSEIVIISAADCIGTDEYNSRLSLKRASRLEKSFKAMTSNHITKINVGERLLLMPCDDRTNIKSQQLNRYSYIFIINP